MYLGEEMKLHRFLDLIPILIIYFFQGRFNFSEGLYFWIRLPIQPQKQSTKHKSLERVGFLRHLQYTYFVYSNTYVDAQVFHQSTYNNYIIIEVRTLQYNTKLGSMAKLSFINLLIIIKITAHPMIIIQDPLGSYKYTPMQYLGHYTLIFYYTRLQGKITCQQDISGLQCTIRLKMNNKIYDSGIAI